MESTAVEDARPGAASPDDAPGSRGQEPIEDTDGGDPGEPARSSPMLRLASLLFRGALIVVVLGAGFGIFSALVATKPEQPRTDETEASLTVRAIELMPVPVRRVWEGYGTVRSMASADVSAQVAARVIERPETVEAGLAIREGDLLVRLQQIDFSQRVVGVERQLDAIEADLEALGIERTRVAELLELAQDQASIAEDEYERAQDAFDDGVGARTEVDARLSSWRRAQREAVTLQQQLEGVPPRRSRLEAQRAQLGADLAVARENLARTEIRAPISGVLQAVDVREGELLTAGARVARVVDVARLEVPLRIPASAASLVTIGDEAEVRQGGGSWSGVITRIAPEADDRTRSITVFVEVVQDPSVFASAGAEGAERAAVLLPGQFVSGSVRSGSEEARLVLPRRAVRQDRVLVASEDAQGVTRVREVGVSVAFSLGKSLPAIDPLEREWVVLSDDTPGLAPGDRLIISNLDDLIPGMPVAVGAFDVSGGGSGSIEGVRNGGGS